jgi:hypothetical protein
MKVTTKVKSITPELAQKWLASSQGNRTIRSEAVASLVNQMKSGLFSLNGESIIFDEAGTLIDGHHRLMAIALSNKSIESVVVHGVEKSAVFTLDAGLARTMGDHLTLAGGTNATVRASYLKGAIRAVAGVTFPQKTVEAYRRWEPLFNKGTEAYLTLGLHKSPPLRKATVAGPLIMCFKKADAAISQLFHQLHEGAELKSGSAALTLREYLISLHNRDHHVSADTQDTINAKVCGLALAHINGREMKRAVASWEAVDVFRKAYNRTELNKLLEEVRSTKRESAALTKTFVPGKTSLEELQQLIKTIKT